LLIAQHTAYDQKIVMDDDIVYDKKEIYNKKLGSNYETTKHKIYDLTNRKMMDGEISHTTAKMTLQSRCLKRVYAVETRLCDIEGDDVVNFILFERKYKSDNPIVLLWIRRISI